LPHERLEYDGEIAELSKQVGLLELRGAQPGSHIQIDGNDRGTTPVARPLHVLRGPHRVRIRRDDTAPFNLFIEVTPVEPSLSMSASSPSKGAETPPLLHL
jgi:hypothetical protein